MTATYSLAGLFDALNQCREPDFVLLGVIADALEEAGDERAEGYRWAVEERRFPLCGRSDWAVWLIGLNPDVLFPQNRRAVINDLYKHWSNDGRYSSPAAAFDDLCKMLRKRDAEKVNPGE